LRVLLMLKSRPRLLCFMADKHATAG